MKKAFQADHKQIVSAAVVLVSGAVIAGLFFLFLPPAVDWETAFRPAARIMLSGQSPYQVDGYFNPPWALIPLVPLALLPVKIGRAAGAVIALLAYAYTAHRLGAKKSAVAILLLSPPVFHSILNGSIDWMAVLGFVLPPQIGLFLISIKPQVGAAVGAFWLIEAWQTGGFKRVVRVFGPFAAALMLSFVLFGLWPLRFEREIDLWWNASLWPISIPLGLGLLAAGVKNKEIRYAMAGSPWISPYVLLHSYIGVLLAVVHEIVYLMVGVVGLWLVVILQLLTG